MIGLLLARRHPGVRVFGVEIQRDLAAHAAHNALANALAGRCHFVCADARDAPRLLPPEHFHRVVANPPFRRQGSGAAPPDPGRARARLESSLPLGALARAAAALLRYGGAFDLVHLPERLPEICRELAAAGLEPKQLRLVAPFEGAAPRLCLVAALKGARPGLRVLPQLVLHHPGGRLTDEALALIGAPPAPAGPEREKRHARH